jgi:hypothetical protein
LYDRGLRIATSYGLVVLASHKCTTVAGCTGVNEPSFALGKDAPCFQHYIITKTMLETLNFTKYKKEYLLPPFKFGSFKTGD